MDQATIHTVNEALQQVHEAMVEADRKLGHVLEQAGRTFLEAGKALKATTNLRPAPFFLTESVVRDLIEPTAPRASGRTVDVPVVSTPLVDRPRRSEDPRLAKANDDVLQPPPGETIRSGEDGARGAASGSLPVPEAAPHPIEASADPEPWPEAPHPADSDPDLDRPAEPAREDELQAAPRRRARKLPPEGETARKSDVMFRQAKDRDARELEKCVDEVAPPARSAKLPLPSASPRLAMPLPGTPVAKRSTPPVATSYAQRKARLEAAIAYLRRSCILETVVDRDAQVRKYRVTGKRDAMLAEDVIAIAVDKGFEGEVQADA